MTNPSTETAHTIWNPRRLLSRRVATLSTTPLRAFAVSTTPLPAPAGQSGIPEVPSGSPSPPQSPPLAAIAVSHRRHTSLKNACTRRGGAFTITEECERLFCETLKTIFLGEGDLDLKDSLVMGSPVIDSKTYRNTSVHDPRLQFAVGSASPESSSPWLSSRSGSAQRLLTDWIEMWDYSGGARFRGFIADGAYCRSMVVFFDKSVLGHDLKHGLMALLELCNIPEIECSKLIVCVDRTLESDDAKGLMRDLGWVGFEPLTLEEWTGGSNVVSQRWMLLGMET